MEQPLTANAQQIKAQLEALIRLQGLDNEMKQRREAIREREERVRQAEQAVQGKRQQHEETKHQHDGLLKDRREAERATKEKQEQIAKLSSQLYEVKTNEAYGALQNEIKQKKQENALLEERILEMMLSEDELQKNQARILAEEKAGQSQAEALSAQARQEIAGLESEIAELQARWEAAAQAVQPEYLERYRRLRDGKGGVAMAKIENDVCSGCQLTIRPQAAIELKKYRQLLFCDNCARILYVD